jgi:hypothetical protein
MPTHSASFTRSTAQSAMAAACRMSAISPGSLMYEALSTMWLAGAKVASGRACLSRSNSVEKR